MRWLLIVLKWLGRMVGIKPKAAVKVRPEWIYGQGGVLYESKKAYDKWGGEHHIPFGPAKDKKSGVRLTVPKGRVR